MWMMLRRGNDRDPIRSAACQGTTISWRVRVLLLKRKQSDSTNFIGLQINADDDSQVREAIKQAKIILLIKGAKGVC